MGETVLMRSGEKPFRWHFMTRCTKSVLSKEVSNKVSQSMSKISKQIIYTVQYWQKQIKDWKLSVKLGHAKFVSRL